MGRQKWETKINQGVCLGIFHRAPGAAKEGTPQLKSTWSSHKKSPGIRREPGEVGGRKSHNPYYGLFLQKRKITGDEFLKVIKFEAYREAK